MWQLEAKSLLTLAIEHIAKNISAYISVIHQFPDELQSKIRQERADQGE